MSHANVPGDVPPDFLSALDVLNAKPRLEVEDIKLLILVEMAGEPLYASLAALAPTPEAADLLKRNGREETAHAHRLKKAIELLIGAPFEIPPLEANPYAEPNAEVAALLRQNGREELRHGERVGRVIEILSRR